MATTPTPFDATTNQLLTASQWDSQVRDVLLWLMGNGTNGVYPRAHIYDNTTFVVPHNSATLITFAAEINDTDSMHSTSTNPSRIIFTTAGYYDVDALFTIGQFTYSVLTTECRLNAGGVAGGGTSLRSQPYDPGNTNMFHHIRRFFNAGDYIEYFITQNHGGATASLSSASFGTRVFVTWLAVS